MKNQINDRIEEDTIRSRENLEIKEKMAEKRARLERKCRAKLSTSKWFTAIEWLMRRGVATVEDWDVVRENVGESLAVRTAMNLGFPINKGELYDSNIK